ncbi:MAG: hypothetical protein IPL01_08420 [Acidobacteria bacterium]|nr:hypothetical protein [Acidobacteriota bacterium]
MSYAHKLTGSQEIRLRDFDPEYDAGLNREDGEARLKALSDELMALQEMLYAAGEQPRGRVK